MSDAGIAVLSGLQGDERVVYSAGAFLNVGREGAFPSSSNCRLSEAVRRTIHDA